MSRHSLELFFGVNLISKALYNTVLTTLSYYIHHYIIMTTNMMFYFLSQNDIYQYVLILIEFIGGGDDETSLFQPLVQSLPHILRVLRQDSYVSRLQSHQEMGL